MLYYSKLYYKILIKIDKDENTVKKQGYLEVAYYIILISMQASIAANRLASSATGIAYLNFITFVPAKYSAEI